MKNYEEMAQSVLKRRDIEIKRRRRAFLIGAPCAAAVLVGVVGIGATVASQSRGKYINFTTTHSQDTTTAVNNAGANDAMGYEHTSTADGYENSGEVNSGACIDVQPVNPPVSNDNPSSVEIATEIDPPVNDYSNPNAGINDIKVLDIDEDFVGYDHSGVVTVENDFTEYSLEQLDSFYGLRFNRLGDLYPNWKLSYDKLGVYRRETNDGFVAKLEMYDTCNTLKYTTESGAEIEVAAQYGKFIPVSRETLTADKPVKIPAPEIINEYDENGNLIGQTTPAYDPTKNPNTPTPDEGVSIVNGYEALIYRYDTSRYNSDTSAFVADLDMASRVRISAVGRISEEEFLEILDNFTK